MEISAPQKKEVVREFLKKGVLISSEVLGRIKESDDLSEIRSMLSGEVAGGISVITEDAEALLLKRGENVNWAELDKLNTLKQKGMHPKPGEKFSSYFSEGIKNVTGLALANADDKQCFTSKRKSGRYLSLSPNLSRIVQ